MTCSAEVLSHWATVLEVAMHFNNLLALTRSLVASVMLAVFGAAILSTIRLKGEKIARIWSVPIGVVILIGGLTFLFCMFLLDHFYYYKLLLGTVDVAVNLEKKCPSLPPLTLELGKRVPREAATLILELFYGAIGLAILVTAGIIWHWDHSAKPTSPKNAP